MSLRRTRGRPAVSESDWLTGRAAESGLDAWLAGAATGPARVRPDVLAGVLSLAAAGAAAGSGVRPALTGATALSPAHARFAAVLDAALASGASPVRALAAARAPGPVVALLAASAGPARAWAAAASHAALRVDVAAARARAVRVVLAGLWAALVMLVAALWLTPAAASWARVVLVACAMGWVLAPWAPLRAGAGLDAGTPAQLAALVLTPAAKARVLASGLDAFEDVAAARANAALAGGAAGPLAAACSRAQERTRADADALAGTLAPFAVLAPLAVALAWVLTALAA